ncbi:MAG: hypothetical protein ND807_12900 [Vicinamibacterales bacterium]|nr:hypothetical protein [Vicinamibacterales bacterium]
MSSDLSTTNLILGIIAAVSVLEAVAIAGMGIAGFLAFRKVMAFAAALETRQVMPAMTRVHAILDDVKDVTSRLRDEAELVDQSIHRTIDRIDDTTERVRLSMRAKMSRVFGFIRGLRVVLERM